LKTYLRLLSYVKPYWKSLSISILCTVLYASLNGASIYLTIPLLDTLFQESGKSDVPAQTAVATQIPGNSGFFQEIIDDASAAIKQFIFSGDTSEVLFKLCTLIMIAFLGKNIFGYLQSYYLASVEQGVIKDIRNDSYRHLHELPMNYFKNEKTGNLISRIINDVNVVQSSVSTVFLNMIREPLTIAVFLGIAFSISWKLTIFSLTVLPFSLFFISWIGFKLKKQSTQLQEKVADITTVLHETISGVKIVKAFGAEEYENKKFGSETRKYFLLMLKMVRTRNAASPVTEFLSVAVGVIIIYYGGHLVLEQGTIKASEFLGFLFAIFQLMPPIKELSSINNRIQESSAAGDRIFEIMDTEPEIRDSANPVDKLTFDDSIEFRNINFTYPDSEENILTNINFKAKRGQIIALVGSSGAGKTTLVDLLPRFHDPVSGEILIDGINIRDIRVSHLRKLMGIVTQETVLFNDNAFNNIAYGQGDTDPADVERAAGAANADKFIKELPKGYNTIIGERGTKLSGGQRQRISIARALLKNPPIMIFDEATSALDNESEALVQEAIERLMTDRTTFVIAHRLSTIRNADVILVMDKGRIVQSGKHDELLTDESGIYRRLYELQFRDQK